MTTLHGRLDLPELVPVSGIFRSSPGLYLELATSAPGMVQLDGNRASCGCRVTCIPSIQSQVNTLPFLVAFPLKSAPIRPLNWPSGRRNAHSHCGEGRSSQPGLFERVVEPLLDHPLVEFVGEVTDAQKNRLYRECARLFICPYEA